MTDPPVPVKNPRRVPWVSQVHDPVGTVTGTGRGVQIVPGPPPPREKPMSVKVNRETGNAEIQVDGIYEHAQTKDRFKFRKGQVIPEGDAKFFNRVGPWPGETDEEAIEAQATAAKANAAPQNKAASAPENKNV
jgi:hypothetical protein